MFRSTLLTITFINISITFFRCLLEEVVSRVEMAVAEVVVLVAVVAVCIQFHYKKQILRTVEFYLKLITGGRGGGFGRGGGRGGFNKFQNDEPPEEVYFQVYRIVGIICAIFPWFVLEYQFDLSCFR